MSARWTVSIAVAFLFISFVRAADRSVEPITSHISREPVESTALASVGYSKRLHALEIEFRDGLVYRYLDIPAATYLNLINADSQARYYNDNVRGKYRCVRVKPRRAR